MPSLSYNRIFSNNFRSRQWSPCREVLLGTLRDYNDLDKVNCEYRVKVFPKKPMRLANEVLEQYNIPVPEHQEECNRIVLTREHFKNPEVIHAYLGVIRDGVPLNLALLKTTCFLKDQHNNPFNEPGMYFNGCQSYLLLYHPGMWADYFIKALIEDGKYYPQAVGRNKLLVQVSSLAINYSCEDARKELRRRTKEVLYPSWQGQGDFSDEDCRFSRGPMGDPDHNIGALHSITYGSSWNWGSKYTFPVATPVTLRAFYIPDKLMGRLVYR